VIKAGGTIKSPTKATGVNTISNLKIRLPRMIDLTGVTAGAPIMMGEGPTVTVTTATTATWAASAWAGGDERISDSEGTIMKILKRKAIEENAVDPVCGMTVVDGKADWAMAHGGHLHYFCSQECRMTFKTNPAKYVATRPSISRGWFRRFLDRLARTNEKEFVGGRPACCG
jgi:YHS domain-containing protein